jgi:hypothetical protein
MSLHTTCPSTQTAALDGQVLNLNYYQNSLTQYDTQNQLTGQELKIVQSTDAGAGRLMSLSANQGYNASNNQMAVDNELVGMWKVVVTA